MNKSDLMADWVPIEDVIPYENNPRKNQQAITKVVNSLREFGWQAPIIVNEEMVILAGHTRLAAAQSLGQKQVPIRVARGLTPEQQTAFRIMDNRSGEASTWDEEKLLEELLLLADAEFHMPAAGYTVEEIKRLEAALEGGDFDTIKDAMDAATQDGGGVEFRSVTFIFSSQDHDVIQAYIDENGKDPLVRAILDLCQGES